MTDTPELETNSGFDRLSISSTLEELGRWSLDPRWKGIPSLEEALMISDVPSRKWNLLDGDLPAPVAIIRKSALDSNAVWIKKLLVRYDLLLAPHAKTTMSPHLFAHQAEYCWGLTVATAQQAEVAAYFGCRRLILANELIGGAQITAIIRLLQRHHELVLYLFVDSIDSVRALMAFDELHKVMPRLRLLIDVGFSGGRSGCRTLDEAKSIIGEISRYKLCLAGIGGYEGLIANATGKEDAAGVEQYFDVFERIAAFADSEGSFIGKEIILTAGGSSYYDIVGQRLRSIKLSKPTLRILRSGCYVTHDCGTYHGHQLQMAKRAPELAHDLGDLEPALFVCGLVQSRPEPNLALITMGKRDVGIDVDLPVPVWHYRKDRDTAPKPVPENWKVFRLNDQHAYLKISGQEDVKVGDLICFGISHPCTTFDRWRLTHLIDDNWNSIGVLPTFF